MSFASFKSFRNTGKVNHEETKVGQYTFDSKAEAGRYIELLAMQKSGIISDLELQPRYEIIPKQEIDGHRNFQAAHYTADFQYKRDGKLIVEDVKSEYTRQAKDYILRRKLMMYVNGIYVEEVVR